MHAQLIARICSCTFIMLLQGYLKEALKDRMKYLRNTGKPIKRERTASDSEPKLKKPKMDFKQFPQLSSEPGKWIPLIWKDRN